MTTPLPAYRTVPGEGGNATVYVTLPDYSEAQLTMAARLVGTPAGDDMIRLALARHLSTVDIVRTEGNDGTAR